MAPPVADEAALVRRQRRDDAEINLLSGALLQLNAIRVSLLDFPSPRRRMRAYQDASGEPEGVRRAAVRSMQLVLHPPPAAAPLTAGRRTHRRAPLQRCCCAAATAGPSEAPSDMSQQGGATQQPLPSSTSPALQFEVRRGRSPITPRRRRPPGNLLGTAAPQRRFSRLAISPRPVARPAPASGHPTSGALPRVLQVLATQGRARVGRMTLPHYVAQTPMFMPVGTQGTYARARC